MALTRRHLLRNAWRTCTALLGGAAIWTSWELLRPLRVAGASGKLKVGNPADYKVGTATFVREGRLWIVNANGHLRALSQKCPHLGCRVPFCDSSGRFECACHGSIYDLGGERIAGPTPRGMDQFAVSVEADQLMVDLGSLKNGPDPGANAYVKPPKGPSCIGKA